MGIRSLSVDCRNTENQKKKKKNPKNQKHYIVLATVQSRSDKTPRKKRQHDPDKFSHITTITITVLIGSSNQCIPGPCDLLPQYFIEKVSLKRFLQYNYTVIENNRKIIHHQRY